MLGLLSKMFGRKKSLQEGSKPGRQMSLEDFNISNFNNRKENIMDFLDVEHITFERGGFYDEEE